MAIDKNKCMRTKISDILATQFAIEITPGTKGECPHCHHNTFSIKKDDTLGMCFHPSCGRYISAYGNESHRDRGLSRLLESIYHDFHKALIGNKDNRAYRYLSEERRIHHQVIADSMLGMVPVSYDLEVKIDEIIGDDDGNDENSKALASLRKCINGCRGWLCFFYTDHHHYITSIRFRKPYSKEIRYFKPFDRAGLFGHGLFSPEYSLDSDKLLTNLIITEGEFNQLQLQSLCVRHSEAIGKPLGYLPACSVGGVQNADLETLGRITRHPVICYDNDSSGAGFVLVRNAQELLNVEAFTTPEPDSDLDDYIRGFGDNHTTAWEELKRLINDRHHYPRHFEPIAKRVFENRQKKGLKEFEINAEAAQIIRDDLLDRGKFYNDGQAGYFFDNAEKTLIKIDRDYDEYALLLAKYGIIPSESISKYLTDALRLEALANGIKSDIYRMSYYDPSKYTLYLFRYDNRIYKISPNDIALVDNGTDGVLFLSNQKTDPFDVGGLEESLLWYDKAIVSGINFADDLLTKNERCLTFILWYLSLYFESIMPTKAIMAFIGERGSGKSITMRKVGKLLQGRNFDVTPLSDDPKDFDAAVTNFPFVAIDNADSNCKWLNDRLATVATGGTIKKRVLYTTNKVVEIPARCFLAITSRTPRFRRDDVADRLLIMRVERYPTFIREKHLLDEVTGNRNEIMAGLVPALQEVVRALKQYSDSPVNSGVFRMADFADFALKIARYAGIEDQVKVIFEKLSKEQSRFTLENDPVLDLLESWINKPENINREITSIDLCKELTAIAEEQKINFFFRDKQRAFAQQMGNLKIGLSEYYDITENVGRGRKKYYSFRKKTELEVI